jgi:hypothetical protein
MQVHLVTARAKLVTIYRNPRVQTVCQFCGRYMIEATACVMCEKLIGHEVVDALHVVFFFLH